MRRSGHRCPAHATLEAVGGDWKIPIIWHLFGGTMRFSELLRALEPITQKTLTQQLRQLEHDGIVSRMVYAQVPPRVEYSLTPRGMSLKPVVQAMCRWGEGRCGE